MGYKVTTDNEVRLYLQLKERAAKEFLSLELVNYGIAFRLNDIIVMNRKLLKYEDYCLEVFSHEIRHTGKFDKQDLFMDVAEGSFLTNLKFALKHPSAFTQFIPFGFYKKQIMIDVNLMIVYSLGIGSIFLFIKVF